MNTIEDILKCAYEAEMKEQSQRMQEEAEAAAKAKKGLEAITKASFKGLFGIEPDSVDGSIAYSGGIKLLRVGPVLDLLQKPVNYHQLKQVACKSAN
jgi:hypothetical protein